MGIGRLGFLIRLLGLTVWLAIMPRFIGSVVWLAIVPEYAPYLGVAMLIGGLAWFLLWVVPGRLANAGMARIWSLALFIPFVNVLVLLMLLLMPPKVQIVPSEVSNGS